jgi:hypothetical protein
VHYLAAIIGVVISYLVYDRYRLKQKKNALLVEASGIESKKEKADITAAEKELDSRPEPKPPSAPSKLTDEEIADILNN